MTNCKYLIIILVFGLYSIKNSYAEGYHKKIIQSGVQPWKPKSLDAYSGYYRTVDSDDNGGEQYYYLKLYLDESGHKWMSIVLIECSDNLKEPTYKIFKGKIINNEKLTTLDCIDGKILSFVRYSDPETKKSKLAIKSGEFIYAKELLSNF
jgi:hypothetical protein